MDRWHQYYPAHTLAVWFAIAAVLWLINTQMRKYLHQTELAHSAARSQSTISAETAFTLTDQNGRPPAGVTTVQQVAFLLACHGFFGGWIAGIGAEQFAGTYGIDAGRIIYWTFTFLPAWRMVPTAIGACWLIAVAAASYTGRHTALRALTYRSTGVAKLLAICAFVPIIFPLIIVLQTGWQLPGDLHLGVATAMMFPGLCALAIWLIGRSYTRAFRRYALTPPASTDSR